MLSLRPCFPLLVIAVSLSCRIASEFQSCPQNRSLYFIDDHFIECLDLTSSACPTTVVSNIFEGIAIDIDVRNRVVFWSDLSAWTINKMDLSSGEVKIIIKDNIGEVFAIAVEWEAGLIYWSDFVYERIEVAKLDGTARKTIATDDVSSPTGIAVDPRNGCLFWCDHDYAAPKIVRSDLSGDNHKVLRFRNNFIAGLPFYITVDYQENRIYWTEFFILSLIASMDYNGNNAKLIKVLDVNYFPLDMTIYGKTLYWADFDTRRVQNIDLTSSPASVGQLGSSDYYIFGVVVSDVSRQPIPAGQGPCAVDNGHCSDLCFITPSRSRKCACPEGVTMSGDGMTCNNETLLPTQAPAYPVIKVRLRGSSRENEGRVEVFHQGEWGTICDDYWGLAEAHVICRMLNYSGADFASREAAFGEGSRNMPIWLDNVKCRGDETTIAACRHQGWEVNDCEHFEDAGVVCFSDNRQPIIEPTLSPGPHPEMEVRLSGGNSQNEGTVQILLNGTWGTICDDYFGIEEANVVCKMMNYTNGALTTRCCGWYNGFGVAEKIWLDDLHCAGDETTIAACRHGGWGRHNCRHTEDVGVVCKQDPVSTPDQIVRLVDGARNSEGRVEIFHDGQWGTICDDQWDENDAHVICKMLNFSQAVRAHNGAFFGSGNGKIWLADVGCTGNESSILNCVRSGWDIDTCGHHEDASVICQETAPELESKNFVLVSEAGRSLIYHMTLDPSLDGLLTPLMITADKPIAVTYHLKEQRVYWGEVSGAIFSSYLNGSSRKMVISESQIGQPSSVAIDYAGQNLYVADQLGHRILVSKLDGSYLSTVINITSPTGIELDSDKGYLYFASSGINPKILRAEMDGANHIILHNLTFDRGTTVHIALDNKNRRLYYSDEISNLIKYIDLVTLLPHPVLGGNPRGPVGLALFNDTLYWIGGERQTFSGALYKAFADKANGSIVHEVTDMLSFPKGLYVHDSSAAMPSVNHRCVTNTNLCSYLCIIHNEGYRCACPGNISNSCESTSTSSVTTTRSPSVAVQYSAVISSSLSSYGVPLSSVSFSSSVSKSLQVASSPTMVFASSSAAVSSPSRIVASKPLHVAPTSQMGFVSVPSSIAVSPSKTAKTIPPSSSAPFVQHCLPKNPCQHKGKCRSFASGYMCLCQGYYAGVVCDVDIGPGVVVVVLVNIDTFNKTEFKLVIVEILNDFCLIDTDKCYGDSQKGSKRKRSFGNNFFKPKDIIIPTESKVNQSFAVEFAAFLDGSQSVLPSNKLADIVSTSKGLIEQRLGGKLVSVESKILPTTGIVEPGNPAASKDEGSNGGMIAGILISVVVVLLLVGLSVWFLRVRRQSLSVPYKKNGDEPDSRVASFENPGYDNAAGFGSADDGLYEDLAPTVLSTVEQVNGFGAASNPIYTDIGQQKLSFEALSSQRPEIDFRFGKLSFDSYEGRMHENDSGATARKEPLPIFNAQNGNINPTQSTRSRAVLQLNDQEKAGTDSEI